VVVKIETNEIMEYKTLDGYKEIFNELKQAKGNYQIVCEDYRANIKTKDQLYANKLVGFIEGYCIANGIKIKMQYPNIRKGYLNQSKQILKGYGCNIKHIIDAYAHVLRYINKELK
jgi:hypothetical protein